MNSYNQPHPVRAAREAVDSLMDDIDRLGMLHIGILDEIDNQIEIAESLGAEMHIYGTRAEELRDGIISTFARLGDVGTSDKAWERAFLETKSLYEALVELRQEVVFEVDCLRKLVVADKSEGTALLPANPQRFLH